MRRATIAGLAAVAIAALAAGLWTGRGESAGTGGEDAAAETNATATVQRRDLVRRETVNGTIGYDDSRALYAQSPGTVTGLRTPGSVVRRGQALYWVDGRPVALFYGASPLWRRLDPKSENGADIRQLEQNLVALGYDPNGDVEVDDDWDWATTAAVKRWQDDRGVEETGRIELGEVVFLPGARRIGQLKTTLGAPLQPGAELMDTSSTRSVVTVDLDATRVALVKKGDAVQVGLPDGRTVGGTIVKVGRVAESEQDPQTGEQTDPTIEVEIRLAKGARPADLDEAPVDVSITSETAKNVLSVPVSALLALAEGGYAVEVVEGGSTRLVGVEVGAFADDLVEISGAGIKAGTKVAIPE
jgi:peptidoglycan hydrolase-like protein with peptidoglycan-binding domain